MKVLRTLGALGALVGLVPPALLAQTATLRVLDRSASGVRLEVTADWPAPLATTVEAARARALTPDAARALGAEVDVVDLLDLPALGPATLTIERAEGAESVALAPGDGVRLLDGPLARLGTPGTFRRRPVVDVAARLLAYDAGAQRLTRYRRLVLHVRYGAPRALAAPAGAAGETAAAFSHLSVQTSVLADGVAYKIPISDEGVYRIDAALVRALGQNPATLDPARVRVYHNGGRPVPMSNAEARLADLVELPVRVTGGGDGSFAEGDGVTFFAQGPTTWRVENGLWAHMTNPYTTQTYVFVKFGPAASVALGAAPPVAGGGTDVTTTTGRYVREFDVFNWSKTAGSGLTWVSAVYDPGQSLNVFSSSDLPGYAGGPVQVQARAAVRSLVYPTATVRFEAAGQAVHEGASYGQVSAEAVSPTATARTEQFVVPGSSAFTLSARIGSYVGGTENKFALDYARAVYMQALAAQNGYLRFATPLEGSTGGYLLSGFASTPEAWDVTDPLRPLRIAVEAASGGHRIRLLGPGREVVAFTDAATRRLSGTPRRVAPQNLHGLASVPHLVVFAPDTFRAQATALAELRRREGLRVEVVSAEAVYNEFGGGVADPRAFRDFLRLLYLRSPASALAGGDGLRYALFFGDGHFNYRRLGYAPGTSALANWLPPFQTVETFSPTESYTSDDYFGLLDESEGLWPSYGAERVDIGVGRLPLQTPADANAALDKLRRYDAPTTFGPWRTQYMLAADDGPRGISGENDRDLHAKNADDVGHLVEQQTPELNLRKVYAMSYPRVLGVRYTVPAAAQAILDGLNDGLLVFNYSGHGGPEGLADENLFTKDDLPRLDNLDRLPVFVTATCSFGRWDMDLQQSAAELLTTYPTGGAVAAFSTIRVVYTSSDSSSLNPGLNRRFNLELVRRDATTGLPPRLGDAILLTKQYAVGYVDNGRKFNLLGDPSLRFGLPPLEAVIERVNGVDVSAIADTLRDSLAVQLRALDLVTVEGSVRDPLGRPLPGFNGTATVTAYDADRLVPVPDRLSFTTPAYTVSDRMWRGEVPVVGGRFTAQFIVPRDIAYTNRRGRIAAYVQRGGEASGITAHGAGETSAVRVGGSNPNPVADADGPEVQVFLGDTTFVSGGAVARTPTLVVRLRDQSGINLGAGVGHELLLTYTVGTETKTVNLAPFFRATSGYQQGEIVYRLPELPVGAGRLTVRAWDPVGNVGEASASFTVEAAADLALSRVANFPNPTAGATRIAFEHNQPAGTAAEAEIRVFTLAGRLVRRFGSDEVLPSGTLGTRRVTLAWDGRDADGDRLAPGIYLYRVRVTTTTDDGERQTAESIQRLAVVR